MRRATVVVACHGLPKCRSSGADPPFLSRLRWMFGLFATEPTVGLEMANARGHHMHTGDHLVPASGQAGPRPETGPSGAWLLHRTHLGDLRAAACACLRQRRAHGDLQMKWSAPIRPSSQRRIPAPSALRGHRRFGLARGARGRERTSADGSWRPQASCACSECIAAASRR